ACAAPATAQETGETREEAWSAPQARDQRIVEVKHADPSALARVLNVFPIHVVAHPDMGLITLRGTPEDVEAAAEAAARLDLPPAPTRSIEIVAHVLGASKTADLPGGVPAGLEEVARQLREVFGYRGVELVDSVVLRVRDRAEGQVTGVMAAGPGQPTIPYEIGFNRVSVANGGEAEVRIDGLRFEAQIEIKVRATGAPETTVSHHRLVRLVTDVEVQPGQKAVVGKAAAGAESQGLILVLEARILD
ncbi:MAG TPA: secretin N-terminal domain-containing protein, partial [Thermoanaerobaculia bacterium]